MADEFSIGNFLAVDNSKKRPIIISLIGPYPLKHLNEILRNEIKVSLWDGNRKFFFFFLIENFTSHGLLVVRSSHATHADTWRKNGNNFANAFIFVINKFRKGNWTFRIGNDLKWISRLNVGHFPSQIWAPARDKKR